jgi:hypothetical protein
MSSTNLSLMSVLPGTSGFREVVRRFAAKDGLVTAISDSALPMCREALDESSGVEVVPFGEMVSRVLRLCGEDARPISTSGQTAAAIALACKALPPESPFARTARHAGLHEAIQKTLRELHDWEIDRFEMDRIANVCSPRLAAKLSSLASIDEATEEVATALGRQSSSLQVRMCLESVPELDGATDRILVYAGSEESPLKFAWLEWFAEHGGEVFVVTERSATSVGVFPGAVRIVDQLGSPNPIPGLPSVLAANLFAEQPTATGTPLSVTISSAADSLAEVEWALRQALASERPHQFGIYVRNLESYAPLIAASAERLRVPLRMARRVPLLTNAFARLTLLAIEFCASSDIRTLGRIVQSSYLHLTGDEQARLLSAVREAHATKSQQWQTLRNWVDGEEGRHAWLKALLDWRNASSEPVPLREWRSRLLEILGADERFPWSTKVVGANALMSERDQRARNQMERLLANHVSVAALQDSSPHSLTQIVAICREIWKDADVSIPSGEYGVQVSDDPAEVSEIEHLFVLGMLEGVFPRRRSEEPILTDEERAEISVCRPEFPRLMNSHDRAEREREAFYRICSAAKISLALSYPLTDDSRDNIPASYLSEVERAMGDSTRRSEEKVVRRINYPRTQYAPDIESCFAQADRDLRLALDMPREYPDAVQLATELVKAVLRPAENRRFEPQELKDVLQCPFKHIIRYRTDIRAKRRTERWNSLRKLPAAAGVLAKETLAEAESALQLALETELDRLYSEVPEWELQLLRAGGKRLIQDWLRREFRSRETWNKGRNGVRMNVPFGDEGLRGEMPGGVRLNGFVAGLSEHQNYRVAHMYSSSIDPKNLKDSDLLFVGLHFLALFESGREVALEIESMTTKRELVVMSREGGPLVGHVQDGLAVVDLCDQDEPTSFRKSFFMRVKAALKAAIQRIQLPQIDPLQGDWCEFCDYGELCRRSKLFGEQDSPFVFDETETTDD